MSEKDVGISGATPSSQTNAKQNPLWPAINNPPVLFLGKKPGDGLSSFSLFSIRSLASSLGWFSSRPPNPPREECPDISYSKLPAEGFHWYKWVSVEPWGSVEPFSRKLAIGNETFLSWWIGRTRTELAEATSKRTIEKREREEAVKTGRISCAGDSFRGGLFIELVSSWLSLGENNIKYLYKKKNEVVKKLNTEQKRETTKTII